MYIFTKSSFPKHDLQTWYCHCNLDFWIGAGRVLEKSSIYCYNPCGFPMPKAVLCIPVLQSGQFSIKESTLRLQHTAPSNPLKATYTLPSPCVFYSFPTQPFVATCRSPESCLDVRAFRQHRRSASHSYTSLLSLPWQAFRSRTGWLCGGVLRFSMWTDIGSIRSQGRLSI